MILQLVYLNEHVMYSKHEKNTNRLIIKVYRLYT